MSIPKQRRYRAIQRRLEAANIEYLFKLPNAVPVGKVLVHNQVWPVARRPGTRGSRCWLTEPDDVRLEVCGCGWAPELGQHFQVKGKPE